MQEPGSIGGEGPHSRDPLTQSWIDQYGPLVAKQLEPEQRYSLVKVGAAEFAYTTYDRYVRALGQVWSAGLVPESLGTVDASKLLEIAPNLRAVDAELDELQASDVERSSRFS
jgi:hypothetical protein